MPPMRLKAALQILGVKASDDLDTVRAAYKVEL
jgi:DnaJ-domain-containing protein 1